MKGQGAILNQDYTVNGPDQAASRDTIVSIYATGEGQTTPAGVDGKLAAQPLPAPQASVVVIFGGVSSQTGATMAVK